MLLGDQNRGCSILEMDDVRRSSGCSSPHLVIPPIISSEKDRNFLIQLNASIDEDLSTIDRMKLEQRFVVYRNAFDQVIDYVAAYKPLLSAVKAEYESNIETIIDGQREAMFLSGKLKAMINEPSTIHNYRRREDDLHTKVKILEADNDRIRRQLKAMRRSAAVPDDVKEDCAHKTKEKDQWRSIPGLTLQQSTDPQLLKDELQKLDKHYRELSKNHKARYSPNDAKDGLKEQLATKVKLRDELEAQTELMKHRRHKLKIAVEAAQAYLRIQPPHRTIGDAVCSALARSDSTIGDREGGLQDEGVTTTSFEDDDPTREKEAEQMLEYIEKFNELLEDSKYAEAAIHAANSPRGILRTPETLDRFKDLQASIAAEDGECDPLMVFCEALASTVPAYGEPLNEYMSLECFKCALERGRLDLISHWVSQNRLTPTEVMGGILYDFGHDKPRCHTTCLALAQTIFSKVAAHARATICMVQQGRLKQAMEHALREQMSYPELTEVLTRCPSPQLAASLYRTTDDGGRAILPLGAIMRCLQSSGHVDIGTDLIKQIHEEEVQDAGEEQCLRKAVFADDQTSLEDWYGIVERCGEAGLEEASRCLLASLVVLTAVRQAALCVREMERKEEEEQERKRKEEMAEKKQKEKKKKRRRKRNVNSESDGDNNGEPN